MPVFQLLFDSPEVAMGDYRCQEHKGQGSLESTTHHEIVFVRRGVFEAQFGRHSLIVSTPHALLIPAGAPYRTRHPIDGGDDCTLFRFPADHRFRDMFGAPRIVPRGRAVSLHRLQCEEEIWALLDAFRAPLGCATPVELSKRMRAAVASAQELVAVHFDQHLTLETIANRVGVTRFHLSRAFRALTGLPIHRFQTRARLLAAVNRLDEGADDLATLALDLGFFDQSHFTNAFRREFGVAPSQWRKNLQASPSRAPLPSGRAKDPLLARSIRRRSCLR